MVANGGFGQLACRTPQDPDGVYSLVDRRDEPYVFFWSVASTNSNDFNVGGVPVRSLHNISVVLEIKPIGSTFQGYRDVDRVILTGEPGVVLKEDVEHGTSLKQIGATAFWKLRCFSGFAPDPRAGDLATCEAPGLLSQPGSCVEDLGCKGNSALARGAKSVGTDCAQVLVEGASCRAACSSGSRPKGAFTCSRGEMVGDSACVQEGIQATIVNRIAGTLAVSLNPKPSTVEVSECLAAGLDLPARLVSKLEVVSAAGARQLKGGRLLSGDKFHVKYELDLAGEHTADSIVLKTNALLQANSTAQQRFQQKMLTGFGVEAGQIGSVIAARSIRSLVLKDQNGTPLALPGHHQPEQSPPDSAGLSVALIVSAAVGGCIALLLAFCAAQYCVFVQRKANA